MPDKWYPALVVENSPASVRTTNGRRFSEVAALLTAWIDTLGTAEAVLAEVTIQRLFRYCDHHLDRIAAASAPGVSDQKQLDNFGDTLCLIETFYYHAFRISRIAQRQLGLKGVEANGITIARNKFVEHPEQIGGTGWPGIRDGPGGLRLGTIYDSKRGRPAAGSTGIFGDADELIGKLERELKAR